MKKFFRILLWIIVAALFIGTFVYLYFNSKPKETYYSIVSPDTGTIERTTVLTGTTRRDTDKATDIRHHHTDKRTAGRHGASGRCDSGDKGDT